MGHDVADQFVSRGSSRARRVVSCRAAVRAHVGCRPRRGSGRVRSHVARARGWLARPCWPGSRASFRNVLDQS
jgi:hypothetical protein